MRFRCRTRVLLWACLTGFASGALGAQLEVAEGVVDIDARLSAFEPGDRVLAAGGSRGLTLRELLELRLAHEYVAPARLVVRRREARFTLDIAAQSSWGIHPAVALEQTRPSRTPDPRLAALRAEERGRDAQARWDGAAAEAAWREAHSWRQREDPTSIASVKARLGWAEAALLRRDLATAATEFTTVDAELQRRWPTAPLRHRALLGLAQVAIEKRDFGSAESLLQALDRLAATVPAAPLDEIERWRISGRYRFFRDDFIGARALYDRALARAQELQPDSTTIALLESHIGVNEWRQGDLDAAERRYSRSLELGQRLAPGSVLVAGCLMNLGTVHHLRRDFAAAERSYQRAVDIFESVSPSSPETLRALTNLALAQGLGGRPRNAIVTLEKVLEVQRSRSPTSLDVAYTHHGIGLNQARLRDWPGAAESFSKALAIREANGWLGIGLANSLTSRAEARMALSDPTGAATDLTRALAIYDRLAPESHARAECLHRLGVLARARGDDAAALDLFRRAIDVLDAQQSHLGGSDETRSSYSAYYSPYYKAYLELLLRRQRGPEALETLERYRGRVLRAALAGDGGDAYARLPQELRDQWQALRTSADRVLRGLQSLERPVEQAAEVSRRLAELEEIRAQQDVIAARIREHAPQIAEVNQTRAATLAQMRASLPRDTALLSFAVLDDALIVFVVSPNDGSRPLVVERVPITAADLRGRIDRLMFLLSTPSEAPDARRALETGARDLYSLTVGPVAPHLARYRHWIVVPDGPLHRLPLGVLVEDREGTARYLIESRTLTTVVSATVFGQLQGRERARTQRPGLVAFGDPQPNAAARTGGASRGDPWAAEWAQPLPWARQEVEQIARLMGPAAEVYLGPAATEAKVREVAARAPALHFASHGVLDERTPLESFLLLSGPKPGAGTADDGRLSAREVLELPPLSAALVTLSACNTSSSADNDGEGLMGLTRAFQANGAHAVIASVWKVSDRSTAELMVDFYRYWPKMPADEALARAQRARVDRHPFYWAAFQVSGARHSR